MPTSLKRNALSVSAIALIVTGVLSGPAQAVDYNANAVAACPNTPFCDNAGTIEPGAVLNENFRLIMNDARDVLINQNTTSTSSDGPIYVMTTLGAGSITVNNDITSTTNQTLIATSGVQTTGRSINLNGGSLTSAGRIVDTSSSGALIVQTNLDGSSITLGNNGILVGNNDIVELRGSSAPTTAQTNYNMPTIAGSGPTNGSIMRFVQQATGSEIDESGLAIADFETVEMTGSFASAATHQIGVLANVGTLNLDNATSGNLTLNGVGSSSVGTVNNSNNLDIRANNNFSATTISLSNDGVLLTDNDTNIDVDLLSIGADAGFGASTDVLLTGGTQMQVFGDGTANTMSQNIQANGGGDDLLVNGGGTGVNDYTFSGNITNIELIRVTGNEVAFTGNVTGTDDLQVTGGGILDISGIGGGAITVDNLVSVTDGTLNVGGTTINGDMAVDVASGDLLGDINFGAGDNILTFFGAGTPPVSFANNFNAGGQATGDEMRINLDLTTDSIAFTGNVSGFETVSVNTGELDLSGVSSFSSGLIDVGVAGALDVTGLTLAGDLELEVNSTLTGNVTFDGGDNTLTFNGDGSGVTNFANDFDGGGQAAGDDLIVNMNLSTDSLGLTGNITNFETVTIEEGELDLSGAASLSVGEVIVNDGGAINTGAFTLTDDVTINAGGDINGGVINFGAGAQTFAITNATAGVQTLAANITDAGGSDILNLTAGNALTDLALTGNISGFETINAAGTGTVTLDGTLAGIDDITASGGSTLDLSGVTGGAITVTNDMIIDGSVLEAGATTLNTDLTMRGASTFTGTLDLDLNGQLTFDGNTGGGVTHTANIDLGDVNALVANQTGTVELDGALTGVSGLTVGSNATLDLDGSMNHIAASDIDGTLDIIDMATTSGVFTINATGTLTSDADTLISGTVIAHAGSTVNTATFGAGDDFFNITGTAGADNVTHNVNLGGGNNEINIDGGGVGGNGLTFAGTYSNVDTLNITANDVTANATMTGVTDLNIAAGTNLTATQAIGATNATVDGTYDITAVAVEDASITINATGVLLTDDDTLIGNSMTVNAGGNFGASTDVTFSGGGQTLIITGTAGADTFDENFDGGGGGDVMSVRGGATAATFTGTIDGFEVLSINTGASAFTNTITGVNELNILNNATLDLSGYVPATLTVGNDIDIHNGTLITDAGLALDSDLMIDYQNANTVGPIQMGDNGHTVTIDGVGAGVGASESTITGGTGTDVFVANFDAAGTYTQGHAITDFETLTVTSGTLDMDVNLAVEDTDISGTLDVRDAATFASTTSITVNNGGVFLTDSDTIIDTDMMTVNAGGGFGASTDVVFDGNDTNFSFTGANGGTTLAANLDGGAGAGDILILEGDGNGSDRLTVSGEVTGFETFVVDTGGEVRMTGNTVTGVGTAQVDGTFDITDLTSFDASTTLNVNSGGTLITDVDTTLNVARLFVAADGGLATTSDILFGGAGNQFIYEAAAAGEILGVNVNAGAGADSVSFNGGSGGLTLTGNYTGFETMTIADNAVTFGAGSSLDPLNSVILSGANSALTISDLAAFSSAGVMLSDGTSLTSDSDTVIQAVSLSMGAANLQGDIQLDNNGGAWTLGTTGGATVIDGNIDGGDNSWTAAITGANGITFNGTIADFGAMSILTNTSDVNGAIQDFTSLVIGGTMDITDASNLGQGGDGTITLIDGATLLTDADTTIDTDLTLDDGAGFGASTDVDLADNGTLTFTGIVPGTQVIGQNITDISDVMVNIAGGEINFTGTLSGMDSLAVNGGTVDLDQAALPVDTVTVGNGATLDVVDAGAFGEGAAGTLDLATGSTFETDGDTTLNFDTVTVQEGVSFGATTDVLFGADDNTLNISGNAGIQETYGFDIDGGAGTDTLTVNDGGDINNSTVLNGDISNIETLTLVGGTLAGNVDTGAGDNTLLFNNSHITGSVTSGAGNDNLAFAGTSTISGTFDGGTGGDSIQLNGGSLTVDGTLLNINTIDYFLSSTFTYDNAAILPSNVTGSPLADTLNVNQGGFGNTINFDGGDDTLGVNAATQATSITFADAITFDGAGTDAVNFTQGTITVEEIIGAAGANDAAMTIGNTADVTFRDTVQLSTLNQESNDGMTFYLFDDSTHGNIVLSGTGANDITLGADAHEDRISIVVDAAHQLDEGDVITLITDAGGGNLTNQFDLDDSGNTLFLSFTQDATAAAGTYAINVSVASPASILALAADEATNGIDNAISAAELLVGQVGAGGVLGTIRTDFLNSTTAQEAAAIADTLVSNTTSGVVESTIAASNSVRDLTGRRIDFRRTGEQRQGVSSGELEDDRTYLSPGTRVWVKGFGGLAEQDDRDGFKGYRADTYGTAVGIDTTDMYDAGLIGAAFSYAQTEVDSDNVNNTQTDITSYQVTLYSGFDVAPNTFVNGMVSYTFAENEYVRSNIGGNPALTARADYESQQGAVRMEAGRHFIIGESVMLTPSFNADYTYGKADAFSETGVGNAGLRVETDEYQHLDVGVDVAITSEIQVNPTTIVKPRFNVGYSYAAINDSVKTNSSFLAGGTAFTTEGVEPDEHTLHLGLGMDVYTNGGWQFSAHADAELAEDFIEATGTVRAAKSFE